jgi:hypothetical protein
VDISYISSSWKQQLPSGKRLHNNGKSPFFMGKSTISMAMFNSYVKLPEGKLSPMLAYIPYMDPMGIIKKHHPTRLKGAPGHHRGAATADL